MSDPAVGRRNWWVAAPAFGRAIAVAVVIATLVVTSCGGEDADAPASSAAVTSSLVPTMPAAPTTEVPTTPDQASPSSDGVTSSTTDRHVRTSPTDLYASCVGADCPTVRYTAAGIPVAYDADEKTVTVLEAPPRSITLDIPESVGRLITVGPDDVAYLLVEPTEETNAGRILAVPTSGDEKGMVHEVVRPTDGLGFVFVLPNAEAIEVVDCCGVGVVDGSYPYLDATGGELPGDPSLATWSWEWQVNGPVVLHNDETGESFEVPQQQAEREGPRNGDLRPLADGRVVMLVDDGIGATTAWVLEPEDGTWTPAELGEVLVEAIDPVGAVLTRDQATLAFGLVPLD